MGGWSQVMSLRRSKEKVRSDARILGGGEFVEKIIKDAEAPIKRQLTINERKNGVANHISDVCKKEKVNVKELKGGSRRGRLSHIRANLAQELVEKYGLTFAETGRQLGVSTSAISKIFVRNGQSV